MKDPKGSLADILKFVSDISPWILIVANIVYLYNILSWLKQYLMLWLYEYVLMAWASSINSIHERNRNLGFSQFDYTKETNQHISNQMLSINHTTMIMRMRLNNRDGWMMVIKTYHSFLGMHISKWWGKLFRAISWF